MKVNGSLAFDASSASEIKNLRIEKKTGAELNATGYTSADSGRLVYVTTTGNGYVAGTIYFGDNFTGAWAPLATGGNAFSQTEGDNIETTLGVGINADGTFNAAGFTNTLAMTNPTSFTNAIQQIANYATANDTLYELNDVSLSAEVPSGTKFLYMSGGSNWVDHTLVLADASDVTATAAEVNELHGGTATQADFIKLHGVTASAAELNILDGATLTTTELNFVDGVTSSIQAQLDNKQTLDATLSGLAALASTGIVVETAADVFTNRTLVAPAAGLTIADPAGIAGNPTFALANDLAALEGLTTSGYIVRTGDGTAATRTFSVVPADLAITGDASGVTTDTTFGLAAVTQATSGSFLKFTLDSKGRVVGNTAVVLADITGLADGTYVNVTGDSMSGDLIMGSNYVVMNNVPTLDSQGANKAYVDAAVAGLSWKDAVDAATTGNITLSGTQTVDGVALSAGQRVLVKDQTAPAQNGIYIVAAGAWTRATNMDVAAEFDGAAVFVKGGTTQEGTGWTEQLTVTTVGTDPVSFTQFSGGVAYSWGTGLSASGSTISVNLGAGIAQLPSDEVGIDVVANKAIQLTSTATDGQLTFVLDTGSGLEQSSAGLKISALGVTNAMLEHAQFTLNGDTGTDSLILGDTLQIKGVSTQGISTATTESPAGTSTVTITAADASASQKGVAKFDATEFTITTGSVVLGTVPHSKLDSDTIALVGSTGTGSVDLGGTVTFAGATAPVTVDVSGSTATVAVADATASTLGLASFNAAQFTVTAGAVDLTASLDDLTNVSSADGAATGDLLTKTAGDWQNVTRAAVVGSTSVSDHNDVTVSSPAAGQTLVYIGGQWVNRKVFHTETFTANTSWTVSHSLGQKFCNVTVADDTDNVVIPQSIVFSDANSLVVTFNTAVAGQVMVSGVAAS